jgi:hypothetical protein
MFLYLKAVGGPAIGDLRSRLLRLAADRTTEQRAVLACVQRKLSLFLLFSLSLLILWSIVV